MTYACPKDPTHQSADSDYCSVCGAKIQGVGDGLNAPASPNAPVSSTGTGAVAGMEVCPDCGTPRHDGARFCEVCRYNFASGASATVPPIVVSTLPLLVSLPSAEAAPAPILVPSIPAAAPMAFAETPGPPQPTTPVPPITSAIPLSPQPETPFPPAMNGDMANGLTQAALPDTSALPPGWEIRAVVDASLYADPDPNVPAPVGEAERVFPLDVAEMLIGRRSERKDIRPEIPLNDPGVSHRHAKLQRQMDGSFLLLDVGSTNGTQLNGVDIQPGVRAPLHDGDEITLGCWTRITVHERQART